MFYIDVVYILWLISSFVKAYVWYSGDENWVWENWVWENWFWL